MIPIPIWVYLIISHWRTCVSLASLIDASQILNVKLRLKTSKELSMTRPNTNCREQLVKLDKLSSYSALINDLIWFTMLSFAEVGLSLVHSLYYCYLTFYSPFEECINCFTRKSISFLFTNDNVHWRAPRFCICNLWFIHFLTAGILMDSQEMGWFFTFFTEFSPTTNIPSWLTSVESVCCDWPGFR